jgi:hypothetical protein
MRATSAQKRGESQAMDVHTRHRNFAVVVHLVAICTTAHFASFFIQMRK